jgi:hypothetical protein
MKKIQAINSNEIADILHNLAFDWASRVNNAMPDGVHRRTFVSIVRELSEALQDKASKQDQEFDYVSFLEASGFFEVADHESMEDYPYCTAREDYIENE